MESGAMGPVG